MGERPDSYGPVPPEGGMFGDGSRLSGDGHRGVKGSRNGSLGWRIGAPRCRNWNRNPHMVACLDLERGDGCSVGAHGGKDKDYLEGTGKIHIERRVAEGLVSQSNTGQSGAVNTCEEL